MTRGSRAAWLAATAMALIWNAPAAAQQQPEGPQEAGAAPDSSQGGEETAGAPEDQPAEIVITARKVAEKLSDAPVSVSVVGSNAILQRGLTSIDDFARNATGISFSQAFGRSTDRPVIRGQSNVLAGVQFGVETGAAYFIDGVYYQGDIQSFDPLAIERVEIIKGPQSALYGRNTYAGAINYITKDPARTLAIGGRFRLGQDGNREGALSVSGPILGEGLGFRAGVRLFNYDGEYRNQLTGREVGDENSRSAYVTLVAQPADGIKLRLRGSYQRDQDGPLALFLHGADLNNCQPGFRSIFFRQPSTVQPLVGNVSAGQQGNNNQYFCGAIQALPERLRLNTDPVQTVGFGVRDGTAYDGVGNRQWNWSAIGDWDLGNSGWVVSSLTGLRSNQGFFGTDSDHSEAFFFLFPSPANALATTEPAFANTTTRRQRDFSQEVRLSSPVDLPVRGLVGAYYFRQQIRVRDITFLSPNGVPFGSDSTSFSSIRNRAVFGLVSADILDNLTVTGELRYAVERKTLLDRVTAATQFCAGESGRAAQFGFTGTCLPTGGWKA